MIIVCIIDLKMLQKNFRKATLLIRKLISDWIESVDISNTKKKMDFLNLISSIDTFFLNFNYTKVLEDVYKLENVCHIHGTLDTSIIIGHGEKQKTVENPYIGTHYELEELHFALRKNVDTIINGVSFFSEISNVSEIYSYGFSFSKVDLEYIKKFVM